MTKLIIHVRGGIVQQITASENAEIHLLDWDNLKEGINPGNFEDQLYPPHIPIIWDASKKAVAEEWNDELLKNL